MCEPVSSNELGVLSPELYEDLHYRQVNAVYKIASRIIPD